MKKLFVLGACLLLFASCSIEAIPDEFHHQGEWELVRTRGNFAESERTGEDLEFRETYHFRRNGKVIKTRIENGALRSSITGTYKIIIPADVDASGSRLLDLELQFGSKNPLVANCMDNGVEYLLLTDEYVLLNSWYACDGLYMEYTKID